MASSDLPFDFTSQVFLLGAPAMTPQNIEDIWRGGVQSEITQCCQGEVKRSILRVRSFGELVGQVIDAKKANVIRSSAQVTEPCEPEAYGLDITIFTSFPEHFGLNG